jgi:hypothetical protein
MWKAIAADISLVGSGIQAGALLMFLYGVCPTLQSESIPDWIRIHVSLDRSIERYMPSLNLTTSAASLALVFMAQPAEARWFRIAGLAANVSLAIISEAVNVPLNKQIAGRLDALVGARTEGSGPMAGTLGFESMAATRERWVTWHRWRTFVVTAGFLCYAIGLTLDSCL